MTPTVQTYKRVGDLELTTHVHVPPGAGGDRVGFVFFHGGGFHQGAPEQFLRQCSRLAEQGHVAMTAQYRLFESTATRPADLVADAKSAVRWLRANAERLGVDPHRVVAGGGSAGGHLAACTALVEGFDDVGADEEVSCVPDALALFNPVLDLPTIPDDGTLAYVHDLFGADEEALSPLRLVRPGLPPSIVFQGTDDVFTPVEQARAFRDAMVSCGNHVRLHEYDGQSHGFFNAGFDGDRWFHATMEHLEAFIDSVWARGRVTHDA